MSIINMLDTKDYDDVYDPSEIHLPEDNYDKEVEADYKVEFAQDEPLLEFTAEVNGTANFTHTIMAKNKVEAEKIFHQTYEKVYDDKFGNYNWSIK